jgi:hypothetical protein
MVQWLLNKHEALKYPQCPPFPQAVIVIKKRQPQQI